MDDLLAMIRRIYNGDPEKLLRKVLDVSALRKQLDTILDNPNLTRRLSPEVRQSVDTIQRNLGKQFDAFKKEVDDWLAKGRKTSAQTPPTAKQASQAPRRPSPKPAPKPEAAPRGSTATQPPAYTANGASKRTERFKGLSNKVLGILGEHMADYHCQEVKGWGNKALHDKGQKNPAKLNDASHLVQLWPIQIRGRGIDAVWKSKGAKPYAVIEAKASYDPTKKLRTLLGEAGDKTERDGNNSGAGANRGGGAGRRGGGNTGPTATRQTNGKVTQMSHGWIEKRLKTMTLSDAKAQIDLRTKKEKRLHPPRSLLLHSACCLPRRSLDPAHRRQVGRCEHARHASGYPRMDR